MLRVEHAVVRYGTHIALAGVDLTVDTGETVVVLGPSGCGKSTLLRAIAGLEPLVAGRVRWDDDDLTRVAPHERRFGLVFQDYALFPHRDVRGNVEFGLRVTGVRRDERAARVADALRRVALAGYERRRVATLSGGEQQRVALARALAPSPRLLMFDEPLGALDRALREQLLEELRGVLDATALPALYVTHDHDEAFALADRVAVMRAGAIVQAATPAEVWRAPRDSWTARFLGFGPAIDAPVVAGAVRTPWGDVPAPRPHPYDTARVVVRPGGAHLDAESTCKGVVRRAVFAGDHVALDVQVDDAPVLEVRVAPRDAPPPGATVGITLTADDVLVYPPIG